MNANMMIWEKGMSSSGRYLRTPRAGDKRPGLDFLNLVNIHCQARTFILGNRAVSELIAHHNLPVSYSSVNFLSHSCQRVRQWLPQTLGPGTQDQALRPGTKPLPTGPQLPYVLLLTDSNPFLYSLSTGCCAPSRGTSPATSYSNSFATYSY